MSLVEDIRGRLKLAARPIETAALIVPTSNTRRKGFHVFNALLKRAMDIFFSLILLVILSPAFFFIAVVVLLDGGPVIYRHKRLGKNLRFFDCLKFRSMMHGELLEEYLHYNVEAAAEWKRDHKLAVDPRVTSIGKVLRATSLDELPQLVNVLRGDMSLVGPRPITMMETAHYGQHLHYYASVRPGMTGLWQVSGRNEVDYAARVALDRCYASVNNVLMDFAILASTPMAVVTRHGAR